MSIKVTFTGPKRLDLDLPMKCPRCGHTTKIPMRTAAPGTQVACAGGCGTTFRLGGDDVREAQRAMDDLVDTLNRFGK